MCRAADSGPTRVGERASYRAPAPPLWTRRLDGVFLHPVQGPVVLTAVIVLVFQAMFSWARPLMSAVLWLVQASGGLLERLLPASPLRSLLTEGVWAGVGSVLVFLPQILLLFLFIGILEDSGYLARAALIADRTMAKVGPQESRSSRSSRPTRARYRRFWRRGPSRTSGTGSRQS